MARLALINPPSSTVGKGSAHRASRVLATIPPYGLASLAACLLGAGHKVRVWDAVAEPLSDAQLRKELALWHPDIVGVSVLGPALEWLRQFGPQLRRDLPHTRLIVGNALVAEYSDWILDNMPEVDAVAKGESELGLPAWVQNNCGDSTPGIATRANRRPAPVSLTDKLDDLPFPAWHLLPVHKYRTSPQFLSGHQPFLPLLQSRGCPWSCSFCAQNFAWNKVRYRSMESVVEEAYASYRDFGIQMFGFLDSIFPLKPSYGEELESALAKRGVLGKFSFGSETRADMVWPDTFRALARAGLRFTMLGIESAAGEVLQGQAKIKKMYPVQETIAVLRAAGIRAYGLFVIGLPGETDDHRAQTEKMMLSLPLDMASVGIYSVYAGSPAARAGHYAPTELMHANFAGLANDPHLIRWQKRMMRKFFLRPGFIAGHLARRDIPLADMLHGGLLLLSQ